MSTDTQQRGLTPEQLTMLLTPLNPTRVKQHKGNAHLEAWDVRRWLTRIFGFAGWDDDILSMECIHSVTSPIGSDPSPLKHRCTAVYRVTMRLTVKDQQGNVLGHWDDGATGEGINQVSVGDAHDLALKAALSQALKRCAVNLCDQFGLSLYNEGDIRGVVVRTLGHPVLMAGAPDPAQDAPVTGGELGEQQEAPAEPQRQVAEAVVRKAETERGQMTRSRPTGPASDAWNGGENTEPPRGAKMSSRPQQQKIAILIGEKRGPLSRPDRLATVVGMVGRQIASSTELTAAEAHDLIERLSQEPDYVPPAEAGDGQDFHLSPTVGPEGICADLAAAMEGAADPEELAKVGVRVADLKERGVLREEHLRRLEEAWATRQRGWSHGVLEQRTGVAA